ncbi:hypothetical protein CS542_07040 [Pedobacter sp. IW39]|nr:hypothetical protein CS542_07040 [Pedobacter sp. IW39]
MLASDTATNSWFGYQWRFLDADSGKQAGDIKKFEGVVGKFLAAANQRPNGFAYTLFMRERRIISFMLIVIR